MRFFFSVLVAAIIAAVLLTACNSKDQVAGSTAASAPAVQAPAPAAPGDSTRRVTTVELKDLLAKGQAIVIDVRSDAAYQQGHIKGARSIPATQILQHVAELPRDKMIVTYCS